MEENKYKSAKKELEDMRQERKSKKKVKKSNSKLRKNDIGNVRLTQDCLSLIGHPNSLLPFHLWRYSVSGNN